MIIHKFTSVKEIINSVYRDTQYSEQLPVDDLIYWAYEALELIAAPQQFIPKVIGAQGNDELDVTNYKAELPCDFHKLTQLTINGLPARYTGNTFHHLLDGECCGFSGSATPTDAFIDNFGNYFSPQSSNVISNVNVYDVPTFDINNNYITISVRTGKICMAYWAIPTDTEGFPMVPDDTKYKIAITKYLIMKLRYIDWSSDPDSRGKQALYRDSQVDWEWYVGSATSHIKMPDVSQMESLKNQIVRLVPKINSFDTFFKHVGAKQNKRIQ